MVEAMIETPEYLAWVQQQKDGEDQRRAELVRELALAEEALDAARSALEDFDAAHGE